MTTAAPTARDSSVASLDAGGQDAPKRILMIVSSARTIDLADGTEHETGYFIEEALVPTEHFAAAGAEVTIATPDGRVPNVDPYGLEEIFHFPDEDEDFLASVVRRFMPDVEDVRLTLHQIADLDLIAARRIYEALLAAGVSSPDARELVTRAARAAWSEDRKLGETILSEGLAAPLDAAAVQAAIDALARDSKAAAEDVLERLAAIPAFSTPVKLGELTPDQIRDFDAVFVPGGHGPMVDLVDSAQVGEILRVLHDKGAVISALCHGPAALLSAAARPDGLWLFDGYRMTAFTDEEEDQTKLGLLGPPWYLETALKNAGAVFDDPGFAWTPHVVVDRNLVTGQNPRSAGALADATLKRLEVV